MPQWKCWLKNCPFCASESGMTYDADYSQEFPYAVVCENCGVEGVAGETEVAAAVNWNTRGGFL